MTMANGKICYIEMPSTDIPRSAAFYEKVFGWTIRTRGDGATSFDDVGEVSGTWTERLSPAAPGLLVHIMVKDAAATLEAIVANGGGVGQPREPAEGESGGQRMQDADERKSGRARDGAAQGME